MKNNEAKARVFNFESGEKDNEKKKEYIANRDSRESKKIFFFPLLHRIRKEIKTKRIFVLKKKLFSSILLFYLLINGLA